MLLAVSALLSRASLYGQSRIPLSGTERVNPEETYLITDRDVYIAGEELCFSVYQSRRLTRMPGTGSKVVYVELLDRINSPLVHLRIGTGGFTGAGVLRIPDTLSTGSYFIRAYTNLMRNYPQELYAYRMISVINPFRSIAGTAIPPSDHSADSVLLFPETGSLAAGLNSHLGIRCFNAAGEPVLTRGRIVSTAGDTITEFITDSHGVALLELTPPDTGGISLLTYDGKGTGRRFEMPAVLADGLTFRVGKGPAQGDTEIVISVTEGFDAGLLRIVYDPVSQAPVVRETTHGAGHPVIFRAGSIPEGLARIKVINSNGNELASRWYYNSSAAPVTIEAAFKTALLPVRSQAELEVKITDSEGKPVKGTLTVSAVKSVLKGNTAYDGFRGMVQTPSLEAFMTGSAQSGINDYLLFCTEDEGLAASEAGTGKFAFLPELYGHLITGTVMNGETGIPLAGEQLMLSVPGKYAHTLFTRSDDEGRFIFPLSEYGRKEIVIQPLDRDAGAYHIDLYDPFSSGMNLRQRPAPYYPDTVQLEELNNAIISMQVSNIYNPFLKKTSISLTGETRPSFFGKPDRTVILSDYIQLTTLKEVIKELIPGLAVTGRDEWEPLKLYNRYPGRAFISPPLVILDGVPVFNLEKLPDIPSSLLEKVEVLNVRYFTGDVMLDGIINIISYKGDLSVHEFDRSVFRQEYDMLAESFSVTTPDYSSDSLRLGRIPDYRNTLYWNPAISVGPEGTAEIGFWTSDEAGDYCVTVECVTSDGRRGKKVVPFSVIRRDGEF